MNNMSHMLLSVGYKSQLEDAQKEGVPVSLHAFGYCYLILTMLRMFEETNGLQEIKLNCVLRHDVHNSDTTTLFLNKHCVVTFEGAVPQDLTSKDSRADFVYSSAPWKIMGNGVFTLCREDARVQSCLENSADAHKVDLLVTELAKEAESCFGKTFVVVDYRYD